MKNKSQIKWNFFLSIFYKKHFFGCVKIRFLSYKWRTTKIKKRQYIKQRANYQTKERGKTTTIQNGKIATQ